MRRSTIVLIGFIIVVIAIIAGQKIIETVKGVLPTPAPTKIALKVDPLAAGWVRAALTGFTGAQVDISEISDMEVWGGNAGWKDTNAASHPTAWIASSAVAVNYAKDNGLPLTLVQPSLARTPLVWGGYASRVDVVTQKGTVPLDWESVASAAKIQSWSAVTGGNASWGFIKLAFPLPNRTMSGLAVLFSAAAAYNKAPSLSSSLVGSSDFQNWLQPIIDSVPNFQTLGSDIPKAVAARGTGVADIAIAPESQWLPNLSAVSSSDPLVIKYPAYTFLFDFPLAIWDSTQTTEDERKAVAALGVWLLDAAQQKSAVAAGLRPASGDPDATAALFTSAQPVGVPLALPAGQAILPPSRTDAQGLIQSFSNHP